MIGWAIGSFVAAVLLIIVSDNVYHHQPLFNLPSGRSDSTQIAGVPLVTTVPIVTFVCFIDLVVLWILNEKIRPPGTEPDNAQFKGKFSTRIKGIISTVNVAAFGSLASFLTIFAVTIAAILILSHFG